MSHEPLHAKHYLQQACTFLGFVQDSLVTDLAKWIRFVSGSNAAQRRCGQTGEFQTFFTAAEEWMRPYAVFCVLRGIFGTPEHWRWGALSLPTPEVPTPPPPPVSPTQL